MLEYVTPDGNVYRYGGSLVANLGSDYYAQLKDQPPKPVLTYNNSGTSDSAPSTATATSSTKTAALSSGSPSATVQTNGNTSCGSTPYTITVGW